MSGYVRISDEKDARWHAIRHQIAMDRFREKEERDRIVRKIARPNICPHCGHALNSQSINP